jgi:hypothetical protein
MQSRTDTQATLARLHAALDAVLETESRLAELEPQSPTSRRTVTRAAVLVNEARELISSLLVRHTPVGTVDNLALLA